MSDENSGRKTEFSVRVIIYEGRRLSGSNPRPVVRVRCGELNQKSTKVEKGSSVIWNKEMMFNIESEEKELHKVLMEFIVNDSKRLRSDSIIGSYKLDLGSVYNRTSQKSGSTDHSYLRHWMLLTDPEDFANMPQGYLKVSIIVQGPGDLLPTDSGDDPDDDITKNLLMPAGVTFQHASFTLRVYQAEDLPDMDKIPPTETGKKPDTFLQFSYGGRKEKTEPISNKSSPEWNEELILPVKYPTMCTEIHLEIYDQDVGSDEKIGSVDILLSEISVKESDYGFIPTFGPTFFNIYRKSKRSHSSSIVSQDFLKNAKSGTNYVGKYVGRVLVELVTGHEAIEKPLKRKVSTRQLEAIEKFKNKVDYRLIAVFHDAGMIDKSQANKSIKFEVSIGSNTQYVKCDLFKGDPYYSVPSKSHKPVVSMTSKWEIVEFRYAALNFLLGMVHELEENIEYIKDKMEKNKKHMEEQEVRKEISFCIIEAINDLQKISKFCELNPQDIPEANTLDRRLHQTRKWVVNDIIEKAEKLKNEATKEDDAIEELKEYLKQIKDLSYECQNSIPDVMIEMHGGKSGVASIPVQEIIYNEKGEQFSGKYCGRVQTILLRSPDDKNYKISCCLQVSLWLGRVETQEEIASVSLHLQRLATKEGWETKKENSNGWLMKRGTTEKEIHREILSREVPPSIHFPTAIKLHMRVYLYQAQNLPPIARRTLFERTLLVYVSFMNKSTKFVTPQGGDASNPLWNKTIKLDMEYYGDPYRLRYHCPELFLEVVSKDSIGCLEFLGRASFKPVLTDFDADKEEPEKPALEWRPFTTETGDNGGDVLASAQIFLSDDNQIESEVPSDIRPELKQTHIKLLVWGLRNLKSFRGLNIVRPHVEISIGSIEFKSEPLPNVKREPNFKENEFNFKAVNLPVEPRYHPPIVIRLKDNRLFGYCPTVGEHVITKYDISEFYQNENMDFTDEQITNTNTYECNERPEVTTSDHDQPLDISKENFDWWSKYNASKYPEREVSQAYLSAKLDTIEIYDGELEKQRLKNNHKEGYNNFNDFIQTFRLVRRDTKEFAGELKGKILMYRDEHEFQQPRAILAKPFLDAPETADVRVIVRVYVVGARYLAPKDANGLADPYIKISAGKKKIGDSSNYIPNTLNPIFGRSYELDLILPMEKDLHIELYDYDFLNMDDKIGETVIDLENRYYSKYKAWCGLPKTYHREGLNKWRGQKTPTEWLKYLAKEKDLDEPLWNGKDVRFNNETFSYEKCQKYYESEDEVTDEEKKERLALYVLREKTDHIEEHVETRQLSNGNYRSEGEIELWVDMFPMHLGNPGPVIDITPQTPTKYFLRVVIWNCRDIEKSDVNIFDERMSDIYIKGWMEGMEDKPQKTDVHYRSLDGIGMFNWRFVFPFDYMAQDGRVVVSKKEHFWSMDSTTTKFKPVLHIQAWDNDILSHDDNLGELRLPLHNMTNRQKSSKSATIDKLPPLDGRSKFPTTSAFKQKRIEGWWPLSKIKNGERQAAGKIEMTIEVLSEAEHKEKIAGKARDEPNSNPKLDLPERPATSFNWISSPWRSIHYIVWRRYRLRVIIFLIAVPIALFIVLLVYTLPSNINRWMLTKS